MPSRSLLIVLAVALIGGCTVDGGDCGPAMRYESSLYACVCADDAIQVGGGCQPCAADEVPAAGVCACPPGTAKNAAGTCVTQPGLGDACDAAHPCTDAIYDYCAADSASCTRTCAIDTDCPDAYVCADWEATPTCMTFTGVGATCADSADCAAYDADTCLQGYCLVTACTVGVEDCPRGMGCCDLSAFGLGTACVPPGTCP